MPSPPPLYPLFLKLAGRPVLVVGAGDVAERKVLDLVAAGARVTLVAPEATDALIGLAEKAAVTWHARPFTPGDVEGTWLVFAATSSPDVQRSAAAAAEAARVFVIAVDDTANASAYSGSVIRRDPYTIAISSHGETPALTRLLREVLEQILPDEGWVDAARALRDKWRRNKTPFASRFAELVAAFKERAGR
jgi:siroheme synthase-like protein